jgi:hypothetical protein
MARGDIVIGAQPIAIERTVEGGTVVAPPALILATGRNGYTTRRRVEVLKSNKDKLDD